MECRAYGICLDSQSRGYLGKDRKVSSAAGGNLSRMHKTQETAKESRLNFMYSHLRNRTLARTNCSITYLFYRNDACSKQLPLGWLLLLKLFVQLFEFRHHRRIRRDRATPKRSTRVREPDLN